MIKVVLCDALFGNIPAKAALRLSPFYRSGNFHVVAVRKMRELVMKFVKLQLFRDG
jgi:hypothetical protein